MCSWFFCVTCCRRSEAGTLFQEELLFYQPGVTESQKNNFFATPSKIWWGHAPGNLLRHRIGQVEDAEEARSSGGSDDDIALGCHDRIRPEEVSEIGFRLESERAAAAAPIQGETSGISKGDGGKFEGDWV